MNAKFNNNVGFGHDNFEHKSKQYSQSVIYFARDIGMVLEWRTETRVIFQNSA